MARIDKRGKWWRIGKASGAYKRKGNTMKGTKAQAKAVAKALDAVACGMEDFKGDLAYIDPPDGDVKFRRRVDRLPKALAVRVNKALSAFEEYRGEVEELVLDLDCAASDAD